MNNRIKEIAQERLNDYGFRTELNYYKDFCYDLSQAIENCTIAFESENRDKQRTTCQAIKNRLSELDIMRETFSILLESPTQRKDCFAYNGGKCRVLTELICKNKKCDFFKPAKACSRGL